MERRHSELLKFYTEVGHGLVIPRGYARQLILLCRHYDIPYQIEDQRRVLAEADFKFNGQLKSFQEKAVRVMLSKDFGTLSAPTASGKTVMALYMIAQRRQPALIVAHTKELAFQWVNRIGDFLGIPEKDVGFIGGGKKDIGEKITVALVQTLYKCADEVARHIGYLIVDECHRSPSRTFTEAVTAFDSKYMLGLSATPWRRDKLSVLIFWHWEIFIIKLTIPHWLKKETSFRPRPLSGKRISDRIMIRSENTAKCFPSLLPMIRGITSLPRMWPGRRDKARGFYWYCPTEKNIVKPCNPF